MGTEASEEEPRRSLRWLSEARTAGEGEDARERQIDLLYELWRTTPYTDLERLLPRVADRVTAAIGGDTCSVLLRDRGSDLMRMVASVGMPRDVAETVTLLVGDRIAGKVAATGQPVLVNKDPNAHPLLAPEMESDKPLNRRDEVESSVCAPLMGADGEVHGVLCVSRFAPAEPFGDTDMRLLALFAAQAGAVIAQRRVVEDLTRAAEEAANLDKEFSRTANLAALGQFAATVAHELRNPLSSIKGAAQFLLREFGSDVAEDDPQAVMLRDFLTIVVDEVNGLSRLTTELLDFARPLPSRRETCDIVETVRAEITFLIPELASLGLTAVHQTYEVEQPAWAEVDSVQLGQVLRNLLINAAHAAVSVDENRAEVRVALMDRGGWYEISVEDNGPGVPEEIGEKLWEPFFTTKAKGSGLGLAQVRRVIENHGGFVGYENLARAGGDDETVVVMGTRFTILLPRVEDADEDEDED
jgi:signal transduction histidine kinase